MMALVVMAVFTGAMALALAAIWTTVAPEWRRVANLAAGHIEHPFQPLGSFAPTERSIAVRRWMVAPAPAVVRPLRAVA